jgi:sugar porter (SP) family MFS transporter
VRTTSIRGISAIAALGGLLFGFDTGVISGALLYIKDAFNLSSFEQGVVVSSLVAGAVAGAAVGGRLADRLGRRRALEVVALIFLLGVAGATASPDIEVLVVSRIVLGVAVGAASVAVPLYISELAPPERRGALVSRNQLMITVGIVVAYGCDAIFTPQGDWRAMFAVGALPALALLVGARRIPESPRWLLQRGRDGDARNVLRSVRENDDVEQELGEIRSVSRRTERWSDLWTPSMRPLVGIGVALAVFQQVTGINTVIYYAPTILHSTGLGSAASILSTFGIGLVNVAMTVVAIRLIDRRGRRALLLAGLGGMVGSLALLGMTFALGVHGATGAVAVVMLMLYVASFAIGLGPVFWLLISEIYPLHVRTAAMSVAGQANWLSNFVVSLTFLLVVNAIGQAATFWLYGVLAAVAFVYARARVPETSGHTLEALESRVERHDARPAPSLRSPHARTA